MRRPVRPIALLILTACALYPGLTSVFQGLYPWVTGEEFALLGQSAGYGEVLDHCTVLDTLLMARERHPGQRNSLDALCKRYGVDNSGRDLHGALLDAEILADVYLAMTGGQTSLSLAGQGGDDDGNGPQVSAIRRLPAGRARLKVVRATADELALHQARLAAVSKSSGGPALWETLEPAGEA